MEEWSLSRHSVVKAMLLGSAAPWPLNSTAFPGSCDDWASFHQLRQFGVKLRRASVASLSSKMPGRMVSGAEGKHLAHVCRRMANVRNRENYQRGNEHETLTS